MYLGIEIGGTKLQLGLGRSNGKLLDLWRGTVDLDAGADGIRKQIVAAVPALLTRSAVAHDDLRGIGIGFGGPIDDETQSVIKSHHVRGWDRFPLAHWISQLIGKPATIGNDADVAGLAEAVHGAGRGLSPVFYITIGSGIGGGLIVDGSIYRGCGRGAAEIGHLRTSSDQCAPIVEACASGWSIGREAERRMRAGEAAGSRLAGRERISAEQVADAAANGDTFAMSVLHDAWNRLAFGINQVITLLCPRRIVIGGGVSLMGEKLLFEPLRRFVAESVFPPFADCYDIVPASLGQEVVVHGAVTLACQRF